MGTAFCIGCGCSDHDACEDLETGETCSWLAVDYASRKGVCSECSEHLHVWPKDDDEGDGVTEEDDKARLAVQRAGRRPKSL